jgi:hypothetical protein
MSKHRRDASPAWRSACLALAGPVWPAQTGFRSKIEVPQHDSHGTRGGDMMRKVLQGAVVVLLLLGLAVPLAAQTNVSGSIQGTVKDAQGAVLPGVAVTVSSDALVARKMTAYTDASGVYRFPSLPVGSYVIEAELAGFATVRQEDVRVKLGGALALDITLPQATVAEAITVSAEAPVVSVVSNTVGTSFDTQFLDKQPLPRNYYSLLAAAPGVTVDVTGGGSGMMAYGGTSQSQNGYTLDGVNVADSASGEYWLLPSIQWMQEIQIGGLGANAEYGGYTGGVINGVTKSGGNEFHGGVEYYYTPNSWVSDNDPTTPQGEFKFTDAAISVGGPVMRDKLWFFLSGESWDQQQTPVGAVAADDRKIPRYLGKLTWQADAGNRLMLMAEHDSLDHNYRGVAVDVLPEATSHETSPNYTFALSWESLINANNFISVKATGYDGKLDYLPYHGDDTPGRQDYWNTGIYWVNQRTRTLRDKRLVAFEPSWTLFTDGLFAAKDSHSFKFGGSYEKGSATYLQYRNGGVTYYDDSSGCPGDTAEEQFAYYQTHLECGINDYASAYSGGTYLEWLQTAAINLYAQDSMRLDRLTINFGARYGNLKGGFQQGHGNTDVYNVNFVDPRIGFVWDISGNAKTALKGHWGRYHEKMKAYLYDREASGQISVPSTECYWNPATGLYELDSNGDPGCDISTPEYARMGNYGHQYVDETLLTFEQQLGQEMVVGLDLIDRKYRDIMAMINANEDYTEKTATNNPLTGGTLPIWILNSPQDWVLTTDNGAKRDYRSVVLRVNKRYSHGWSAWTSLVWTDLKANTYTNDGTAAEFEDRNGLTNAYGKIDLSFNEWDFKLSAAVDLPLGFTASGQYTYLSGMFWTPFVRVSRGLDYNSSTGSDIFLVPRGSEQFPARNLVDLRLAWNHKFGGLGVTISGEVFNALNKSTMLDTDSRWGSYNARANTWSGPRSAYGTPTTIENPRQIRAGVRLEF